MKAHNAVVHPRRLLLLALVLGVAADGLAQRRPVPPTAVVVNEVMASNGRFVADPQGGYDDWIELYNAGGSAVDVAGCYLTDDLAEPAKWRIPADTSAVTTIPAQGYLVVWADGDATARGLHAGFRLDDEGEEIGFFAADGITLIDSLSFGPQHTDISYGRYPDGGPDLCFMTAPTPGMANVRIHEGIAERPEADVGSRLLTGPIMVTLTSTTEDTTIYYTADGSNPFSVSRERPMGSIYTGPIPIGRTMTLRAVAWKPGWQQSEVITERYVFVGQDARTFSTPVPIAVVDTLGKYVSGKQTPACGYFIDTGAGARAAMTGPADFVGAGAINVRGKSSSGFEKHQYHFETQDERGDDRSVSILGLPAESDWVLQGPYSDKSLMRNVLAYGWSNELGRYAPRTRFVEMFLNTDNSTVTMSDYVGVYVFMEKIKIDPNRVDIAAIEPSDDAEPDVTGGYIVKKDKFDSDDQTFNTSRGQRLIYSDPNGHELTQVQREYVRNFFNAFEAVLYGANFRDPVDGYAKYIDVGSFIDHHIIVELCKNIDGFRLSTYMFKDRNGKLNMGPVWDYNLSLGNANYLSGWIPTGWYFGQLGDGDYPYWRRLFEDPEFKLRYADRWFALRRELFATDRLLGTVETYATLLDEPAVRNFNRWPVLGRYIWPNWFIAKTFREEIAWMQEWLADRLTWMDSQIAAEFAPAPPVFNQQGGYVDAGFELAMSAPGPIYYTLDDSDPRLLAGPIGPSVGTVLVPEDAPKRVLVPTGPVDDAWRGGGHFDDRDWTPVTGTPGGIGYERSFGYEGLISHDVGPHMYNLQTSCLVRIPFAFTRDIQNVDRLTLRVRYDDGFVAYLNGVEIGRRNFIGDAAWNSAANALHDDMAAVNFESMEIANFRSVLQRGDNVLALHAMNESTTSSDFLISVELAGDEPVEPPAAPAQIDRYTGPVALTESTRVRARSQTAGRWSALNEAVFAVGPVAESLRISEIMFHPADTGHPDDPNTEYIELVNIGPEAINLSLVRFTDGIDFTFAGFDLAPAAYCVVVKDTAAFEARYGPGLPIAGRYTGSLSNAGERLELQDARGRVIHAFEFRDDWYTLTDGLGFSLTLSDPTTADPNALGDSAVWRPSTAPGGSPGAGDTSAVPF